MATKKKTTETKTPTSIQSTQVSKSQKTTDTAINNPEDLITKVKPAATEFSRQQKVDPRPMNSVNTADYKKVAQVETANNVRNQDASTYSSEDTIKRVKNVADNFKAAKGSVSSNAQVGAATAQPSANATVQGQLENLMKDFEGGETPPWAQGAQRKAETLMAQRGLGASTMAADAITQSLMESATQIAIQDASTYAAFEMKNLDNRQQARVLNAQAFLQMDLTNLNNRQQKEMLKSQSIIQSLFTDAAAENAAKQFNATSKNQTNQFFAQLKSQVNQFNAAQTNAIKMQNQEQANAVSMFNAQTINAKKQFNAANRLVIDQSNANWRRQIATQDNAAINEANRQNALAATEMTMSAYNNLWQETRDLMAFAFTASESAADRANAIVLQKLANEGGVDVAKARDGSAGDAALGAAAGSFAATLADGAASYVLSLF